MDKTASLLLSAKMESQVLVAGHMLEESSLMRLKVPPGIVLENKD
jgi:hypothetical protein